MFFLNLIFGPLPKATHIYWWQIQKAHCLKFSKMVWKSDVPVKLTELWAFKHQTQIAPLGQKYKLQIHKSKKLHNCHELAESDQAGYEISHSQWQYLSQFKYSKKLNAPPASAFGRGWGAITINHWDKCIFVLRQFWNFEIPSCKSLSFKKNFSLQLTNEYFLKTN